MAFEGMDVEVVSSLGNQLRHQESAIHSIVSAIDGIVNQMEGSWKGHDATEFQNWWQSQHKPALMNAASAVGGLGQSALNNASAQQQVSQS